MSERFTPIKIVGIDDQKTFQPSMNDPRYNIYFSLNQAPTPEWRKMFEEEHNQNFHDDWRKVWIESGCIVMSCVPDELEQKQLPILKDEIKRANQRFEQSLESARLEEEKRKSRDEIERNKISVLKNRLDFD